MKLSGYVEGTLETGNNKTDAYGHGIAIVYGQEYDVFANRKEFHEKHGKTSK